MGRFPRSSIIVASYGSELPRKFGRRARSITQQPLFNRIFDTNLSDESKAADEWALTNGSEWMAAGILTGITGNRADGIIWDDLIKGREQADSPVVRQKTWDAYMEDLLTRKKPKAFEIGVTCMTGDTPVTMADGTRKRLDAVEIGDEVYTWSNGKAVTREVLNWKPQGKDKIFEIRTGGAKVRANARHPFLVMRDGSGAARKTIRDNWGPLDGKKFEWVRVKDLKVGDRLVTLAKTHGVKHTHITNDIAWLLGYMFGDGWITKRDTLQRGYKGRKYPKRGFVTSVALSDDITENDKVSRLFKEIFKVNLKKTKNQQQVTEVAAVGRWFWEAGLTGRAKTKRLPEWLFMQPDDTRLAFLEGYNCADGHIVPEGKKGEGSWALTSCNTDLMEDVRQLARGVGYKVTNTHTFSKWMQAPNSPQPTYSTTNRLNIRPNRVSDDFFVRPIMSIKDAGVEEVYDVQIEDTECFIADGLVSHNTRWHEDDVAGRILPEKYNGESGFIKCRDGNEWYVVCLPAECEREDDILGRKPGDILWPEWFSKEMFAPFKRNPRTWSSLYQQRPAPDSGVLFKGEWLKSFEADPKTGYPMGMELGDLNIYGASDYAVTGGDGNYTVHIVVGVDVKQDIYVLDLWRGQKTSDIWVEVFCNLVKQWKPLGWAEESGQINSAIGPFLVKRMRERQAFVARAQFPSTKSKAMRAQSIIGRMAQPERGLYCPFGADWFAEFRHELLLFDAGKYDDQVDALSLVGQILDKMIPADVSSLHREPEKVFSTEPGKCTVTLEDLFEANETSRSRVGNLRIN